MSNVLIVTGASRGIGAAIARMAGARGYDVCVNYRSNADKAAAAVADIEAAGARAIAVQADTAQEDDVVRLFQTVADQLGPITGLVNNAGTTGKNCLVEDIDQASLEHIFGVNVIGYFLCAREAIRHMSTRKGAAGGHIVNISSVAAKITNAFEWLHYGASKAAIDCFTRGLALEAIEDGINVNAVRPGPVATDIMTTERIERIEKVMPIGRVGETDEIAEAVLWLMSDQAGFCVGSILDVAGGRGVA